ncbi:MAG: hypothetical protein QXG39_06670 [Candidatus Aenigmatarchaeota archaeon]
MARKKAKRLHHRRRMISYEDGDFLIPLEETPYEAYILIKRKGVRGLPYKQIYAPTRIQDVFKDYEKRLKKIENEISRISEYLKRNDIDDPPEKESKPKTIWQHIDERIDEKIQNALKDLEKKLDEKFNLILEKIKKQEKTTEPQVSPQVQMKTQEPQEDLKKIASEYVVSKEYIEDDEDFKEYMSKTKKLMEDVENGKVDIKKLLEYVRSETSACETYEMNPYMPIIIAAVKNSLELQKKEYEAYEAFCNTLYTLSEYGGFKTCKAFYKMITGDEEE